MKMMMMLAVKVIKMLVVKKTILLAMKCGRC